MKRIFFIFLFIANLPGYAGVIVRNDTQVNMKCWEVEQAAGNAEVYNLGGIVGPGDEDILTGVNEIYCGTANDCKNANEDFDTIRHACRRLSDKSQCVQTEEPNWIRCYYRGLAHDAFRE